MNETQTKALTILSAHRTTGLSRTELAVLVRTACDVTDQQARTQITHLAQNGYVAGIVDTRRQDVIYRVSERGWRHIGK